MGSFSKTNPPISLACYLYNQSIHSHFHRKILQKMVGSFGRMACFFRPESAIAPATAEALKADWPSYRPREVGSLDDNYHTRIIPLSEYDFQKKLQFGEFALCDELANRPCRSLFCRRAATLEVPRGKTRKGVKTLIQSPPRRRFNRVGKDRATVPHDEWSGFRQCRRGDGKQSGNCRE
jgi:hypothetical protein